MLILWLLQDLRPTVSYLSPKELELVHNALKVAFYLYEPFLPFWKSVFWSAYEFINLVISLAQLAFEAHDGQKRRSGEPFIIHPVEVARILGELVSYLEFKSMHILEICFELHPTI